MINLKAAISLCVVAMGLTAQAQIDQNPNHGSKLVHDELNSLYTFSWWGKSGQTYLIQQSEDLNSWQYFQVIENGLDGILAYRITTTADKLFVRLQYVNQTTGDFWEGDFDGDGISSLNEILQGTDPFSWQDLDSDLLPDEWESFWGLTDATADADADGAIETEEFQNGTNPNEKDHPSAGLIIHTPLKR